MATGKISSINSGGVGGMITPDPGRDGLSGPDIQYLEDTPEGGIVGSPVEYELDIDARTPTAINLRLIVVDEPADEGTVETGTIAGDLDVGSGTYTLKGAVVNGGVKVDGGKLIVKTGAVINGDVDFKNGSSMDIYNSKVTGDIKFKDSADCRIDNGDTGGDIDVKNSSSARIDNGDTAGDIDVKNCSVASITNTKIGGDLEMKNNTTCSQSGNTVAGDNEGCV